ncbi:MAG: carboxypeptidase-like regulatory domain-containing protein, partial [Clostridium sp.]
MGNNSKKRVSKVAMATLITAGMILPSIPANAETISTPKDNSKEVVQNFVKIPTQVSKKIREENMQFTQLKTESDLNVSVGTVQREITNGVNEITPRTTVTYIVPIRLSSKSGKNYNVNNFKIMANPNIKYTNPALNKENESLVAKMNKAINVETAQATGLTSTSTFVVSVSINIPQADRNMIFTPNVSLSYESNGQTFNEPLNEKDINVTNQYTVKLNAGVTSKEINGRKYDLNVNFLPSQYVSGDGYFNPANHKLESISFKVAQTNSFGKGNVFTIKPNLGDNLTYDKSTGVYTAKGPYINGQAHNLFTVELANGVVDGNIVINPVGATYKDIGNAASVAAVIDNGGQVELKNLSGGGGPGSSANMVQAMGDSHNWYNPGDTFNSTIQSGLVGDFDVYTGSYVTNAQLLAIIDERNALPKGETFVHLNDASKKIMESGTPEEKADLMKKVVEGKLAYGEKSYTTEQVQNIIKAKGKVNAPNFVYVKGEYTGKTLNLSGYYAFATIKEANGGMPDNIASVMTLGVLKNNLNASENKTLSEQLNGGMSKGNDAVLQNGNKISGFYLGNTGGKVYRYNNISTDTAWYRMAYASYLTVDIDGQYAVNQNVDREWLDQAHKVSVLGSTLNPGLAPEMVKGSKVKIDLGGAYELEGPVKINGVILNKDDYKVEGNYLTVTMPKNTQIQSSSIDFNVKYAYIPHFKVLNVGATFDANKTNGVDFALNGQDIPANDVTGYWFSTNAAQITAINSTVNTCQNGLGEIDSNNNTQVINAIVNSKNEKKQYLVVGELPQNNSKTLAENLGGKNTGGLSGTIVKGSLDSDGAPIWVLPKSQLNNGINKEILSGTNPAELKGKLSYIENPQNGWVKYKSGMDLSNMIGYFANPTVKKGETYVVKYNMHLNGVDSGIKGQTTSTAFKYYDETANIGANSNLENVSPFAENQNNTWESAVVNSSFGKMESLTKEELSKTVTVDGKTYALKDLIGSGLTNDGNNDILPKTTYDNLLSKVKFGTNEKILNELGYNFDYILVNGQKITNLNEFENVKGIINNKGLTKIQFVISPNFGKYTITVIDKTTGKILPSATVNVDGKIEKTNNKGEVTFNNLKPGTDKVTASDTNYQTNNNGQIKVVPNTIGHTTIKLTPLEGTDTIKVIDGVTGKTLPGAKIDLGGKTYTVGKDGTVKVPANESKDGKPENGGVTNPNYVDGTVSIPTSEP